MTGVLVVADMDADILRDLLHRFGLDLKSVGDGESIPESFWGEPEAGIVGRRVYVRADTPIHSLLHETAHIICMCEQRRRNLRRDAGADDIEEEAVCYLQIVLAGELAKVGRSRLMQDMDTWGYSFRVGKTVDWFETDSERASKWLTDKGLVDGQMRPTYRLRGEV